MSTTATKRKPTERELILREVVAKEVAAFDRYVMERAKELSRPKNDAKPPKTPK